MNLYHWWVLVFWVTIPMFQGEYSAEASKSLVLLDVQAMLSALAYDPTDHEIEFICAKRYGFNFFHELCEKKHWILHLLLSTHGYITVCLGPIAFQNTRKTIKSKLRVNHCMNHAWNNFLVFYGTAPNWGKLQVKPLVRPLNDSLKPIRLPNHRNPETPWGLDVGPKAKASRCFLWSSMAADFQPIHRGFLWTNISSLPTIMKSGKWVTSKRIL